MKYLFVDRNLKFKEHIEFICRKLGRKFDI